MREYENGLEKMLESMIEHHLLDCWDVTSAVLFGHDTEVKLNGLVGYKRFKCVEETVDGQTWFTLTDCFTDDSLSRWQ